jgi:hypothetical protein
MTILLLVAMLASSAVQAPQPPMPGEPSNPGGAAEKKVSPADSQPLTAKRQVMQSVIAITTMPAGELASIPTAKEIEHDSEVARDEAVTLVVTVQGCEADARGQCNASADVVAYKPDGSVHSEMKGINLASGRGTAVLKLSPDDATGVYRVEATVRDMTARRFGKTDRLFGVK